LHGMFLLTSHLLTDFIIRQIDVALRKNQEKLE